MRRCFTAVALLIFASSFAFSTANVSGKLVNPNPSIPLPVGSFARFELRNCGGNYPQVSGASVTSRQDFPIATDGTWSGLLSRNDEISCNGSFTTYWTLSYFVRGIQAGPSRDFLCSQASCVFDGPGGLTPLTVYPPPVPPAQPLTGAQSASCTFIAATTWTCLNTLNTASVIVDLYDGSGNQLVKGVGSGPTSVAVIVNSVTATFASPTSGTMYVVNAGNWTPSVVAPNNIISNPSADQSIAGDHALSLAGSLSAKRIEGIRSADQFSSLQAAITDACGTSQPWVRLPANYTATLTGTGVGEFSLLTVCNGLTIDGTGTIKIANGTMPSDSSYYDIIFMGVTPLTNFTVKDITVDFNGTNNLLPAAFPDKSTSFIRANNGSDWLIQNVTFLNNSGTQSLECGSNTAPQTCHRIRWIGNTFHNFGFGVTGNVNAIDHSTVYLQADDSELAGNIAYNDSFAIHTACYEVHAKSTRVHDNYGKNCETGMNVVATVTDFTHNVIEGNVFNNVTYGFSFWDFTGFVFSDDGFVNNDILLNPTTGIAGFFATNNLQVDPSNLRFASNTVSQPGSSAGLTGDGFTFFRGVNLKWTGNTCHDLSGRCIDLFTSVDRIAIDNNTAYDCDMGGHAGFIEAYSYQPTAGTGTILSIRGNAAYNVSGTNMTVGLGLSGNVNPRGVLENSFTTTANILTSGYTGTVGYPWTGFLSSGGTYNFIDSPSGQIRYSLTHNNATNIASGTGANAITLNTLANAGTSGTVFGSGGASPTVVAQMNAAGLLSTYNSLTTVGTGVPVLVAKADPTGQGGNIGSTLLYAVPANGAGAYRVACYAVVTTAATTSSTLPNCDVSWTDSDTGGAGGPSHATSTNTGNTVGVSNSGNVGVGQGNLVFYAKASTNINYDTIGYASSGATAMLYAVHIKLEYLGN